MTTCLVQLSDTHIREPGRLAYGRIDTAAFLRQAVQGVADLPQGPDAVVITGDLCDFGRPAEYDHLAELLAPLPMPVYLMPGNHDDRDELRRSFPAHHYLGREGPVQYSVPVGGLRLLALDSTVPRHSHGMLDAGRLAWLEAELEVHRGTPVVLAMHHAPFRTLINGMDDIGLQEGATELEALVRRHANVERVICGHLHRAIEVRFGGTIASTSPGTAHAVALDLDAGHDLGWTLEPPALRLHVLPPGGRLVTHLVPLGTFDGPYPFSDGAGLID